MSIKLNMVEIAGRMDDRAIYVRASLSIQNEISIQKPIVMTLNDQIVKDAMKQNQDNLRKAIIHYIYGDLLEPINDLAILAQHHLTGMNDANEVRELRDKINDIMKGL